MIQCSNCGKYLDILGQVLESNEVIGCINKLTDMFTSCDECNHNYGSTYCDKDKGRIIKVKDLE